MSASSSKTVSGILWSAVDRFGNVLLQFLLNLVLARLLTPEDYGCVGMLAIFIAVSQTLIDGGFCSALIQKQDVTSKDYSTIFYWNIAFSGILYAILYAISPAVSEFFNMPILCEVLRTLGLVLPVSSLGLVQRVQLRKQLKIKQLAVVNISSLVISAIISIRMAFMGYGVWSLVALQIFNNLIASVVFWFITKWKPMLYFSVAKLKSLFSFGGYLLAASILQEFSKNMQGVIIGHKFSALEMGLYSQAKKLEEVACSTFAQVIVQVMFPVYSEIQDNLEKLRGMLRDNIRLIAFAIFPIMVVLVIVAEDLIPFLLGDKWLPVVPYFQVLCLGGFFTCLQNVNFYAVAAIGKSDTLFRWSFYKWGMLIFLLLAGVHWGIYGVLLSVVLSEFNIFMVNALLVKKYLKMPLSTQLLACLPSLLISMLAGAAIAVAGYYVEIHFLFRVIFFFIIYFSSAYLCNFAVLKDLRRIRKSIFNKI